MEDPVTQAALDYVSGLLETAEAELAITRRDLEITQRELKYAKDELAITRKQVHDPWRGGGVTWNGPTSALIMDEANLFDETKMREALGIPENARLPQDRRPKKSKGSML